MSEKQPETATPKGELVLRAAAFPADTNPDGDIFGGWLLAQMDIAGGLAAKERSQGRVVTVSLDRMVFHKPVHIGDILCCYAHEERLGRTSVTFRVQAWVLREGIGPRELVTEGLFTFVALDEHAKPRVIK